MANNFSITELDLIDVDALGADFDLHFELGNSPAQIDKETEIQARRDAVSKIPALRSPAAVMLAPILPTQKLLAPPPKTPLSELDRQRAALVQLQLHTLRVHANLLTAFRHEQDRLVKQSEFFEADPADTAAVVGGGNGWIASEQEIAQMLNNLAADDQPNVDYNSKEIPMPYLEDLPQRTSSEWLRKQLLSLLSQYAMEKRGYDGHVNEKKTKIEQRIREIEQQQQQSK